MSVLDYNVFYYCLCMHECRYRFIAPSGATYVGHVLATSINVIIVPRVLRTWSTEPRLYVPRLEHNHLQRIIAHPHQPLPLLHLLYLVYLLHLPPSLQLLQGRAYYMPFCSIFEHLYTCQGH